MKKIILALGATVCLLQSEAKVWRVNNNTGVSADFSNLATATAAAAAGDTILVEGSATGYSPIGLTKKLTITGTGYFLTDATPNPNLQFNRNTCSLGTVTFSPGSKGSVIQGCNLGTVIIDDSLITIQRNRITGGISVASSNNTWADTIRNNFITSYITNNTTAKKATDLLIYNNIFTYSYAISLYTSTMNNVSGYFVNNSFINNTCKFECVSFVFQNNIFGNADFASYFSSNTFFNNIAQNTGVPAGNGNVQNVPLNDVFVGALTATGFSSDGRYLLKSTSPAIGAGTLNGTAVDCGAFGGPAPYILSGMPSIPSVYDLNAPAQVVFGAASINVSVSAAAH